MSNSEPTRTMWTKSIYDGLYLAMEKKNPKAVRVALADLKSNGASMPEILGKVREDKGVEGEAQLKRLVASGKQDDSANKGLLARIKDLFN